MAAKKKRQEYMGNPNLPTADAVFEYTPEMVTVFHCAQARRRHTRSRRAEPLGATRFSAVFAYTR